MKIAVLNGSPKVGNTAAMVNAFAEGAKEAGHEVEILHVGKMKIGGCLACEYCHTKGEGKCVQKDDMEKVMPAEKTVLRRRWHRSALSPERCNAADQIYLRRAIA